MAKKNHGSAQVENTENHNYSLTQLASYQTIVHQLAADTMTAYINRPDLAQEIANALLVARQAIRSVIERNDGWLSACPVGWCPDGNKCVPCTFNSQLLTRPVNPANVLGRVRAASGKSGLGPERRRRP